MALQIDLSRDVPRFEAEDTFQFTFTSTVNRPASVQFIVFNTDGTTLAPPTVQNSFFVAESGTNTGLYYIERILPTSAGLYYYQWTAFDAASRTYVTRGYFEVVRTTTLSFQTYADITDVVRTARQIFGRGELTVGDMRPYMEEADAWIDSKLAPVTTVPVSPVPAFLRGASKVGALYMYYSDRYAPQNEDAPPGIVDRWNRYNEMLDALAAGSLSIAGVSVDKKIVIDPEGYKPVFDLREFESQRVDPDLLDATEDRDD